MKIDRKLLYQLAYRVRKRVLAGKESNGFCQKASLAMVKALKNMGGKANIIYGDFFTDQKGMFGHCWVHYGKFIVDLTADQFNKYMCSLMPKIVIIEHPNSMYVRGKVIRF